MTDQNNKETTNPFDPQSLRLSNEFGSTVGLRKLLTTVPVRKPAKQDFHRVHPGEDYRLSTGIIELKDDQEVYLVTPALHDELADLIQPVTLYTAINRQGTVFLFKVGLPLADGTSYSAWESGHEAARRAMDTWVKRVWNRNLSAYEIFEASGYTDDPKWPDEPFEKLLEIAFKGKLIDRADHPVILRLRGEN